MRRFAYQKCGVPCWELSWELSLLTLGNGHDPAFQSPSSYVSVLHSMDTASSKLYPWGQGPLVEDKTKTKKGVCVYYMCIIGEFGKIQLNSMPFWHALSNGRLFHQRCF